MLVIYSSELANRFFDHILNHDAKTYDMNVLWFKFKKELQTKYPDNSVTFICDEAHRDY